MEAEAGGVVEGGLVYKTGNFKEARKPPAAQDGPRMVSLGLRRDPPAHT